MGLLPLSYVLAWLAAALERRDALAALALSMLAPLATTLPDFKHIGALVPFALILSTAWVLGYAIGQRHGYIEAVARQEASQLRAELEQSRAALNGERLRIARELHDLLAHSVSAIAVQAELGRLVIDDDPTTARAALRTIAGASRETLVELRRLLGVLRSDEIGVSTPELTPAHGLADLKGLIASMSKAGVSVDLIIEGQRRPLPAGLELVVYRTVQESLTNVVKHAAVDRATAVIGFGAQQLVVAVTDHGCGGNGSDAGGHGLIGMRERVGLYGGSLRTGPLEGGGFQVEVQFPLAQELQ